jgi:hypothetical protein
VGNTARLFDGVFSDFFSILNHLVDAKDHFVLNELLHTKHREPVVLGASGLPIDMGTASVLF